ncbi:hypothetical protein ACOBQJ_03035 [Pelotomaculum propionicicum]|uniref:hypothetical protein n=1 Tax=Pelotomaculum propionicicum TaxID=258475 RepID=UPI003B7D9557
MSSLKTKAHKYLGYLIIECCGEFGDPYCTVVNPVTKGHVHTQTVKIAKAVCGESRHFERYGRFKTRNIATRNRAARLALRTG